ncbi:MAG: glycogen/starch synthase [Paludibacter sp.]|nr:glycogen/starch synthase [Bacteroidales bacterium]MCM1069356.1 glycogen/starch synthase [Prevotella sp.]MCM1353876.1 glycogen/starch synthase [Bacteroides sp.]MCM1442874.1 glycogen/starch synthase [Muribaculum sp.]MCM1481919.1 glycogen/starch synthase [Paludibacter sp.]
MTQPEYIFETSWEVCNHVGGIYTVLSTRAASMQKAHKDKVIFIGPDIWKDQPSPFFKETKSVLADWKKQAAAEGLHVRTGRWNIPGKPIAVLVDFQQFWAEKNEIYRHFWDVYKVNSLPAYGDYDESSLFGYATGVVIESIYRFYNMQNTSVAVHFNEWMTSFGLFYVREHLPQAGTLFTTHATSIGRSIAGNNKPLYDYFSGYHGDQMAEELNMVAKHSTEKQAALYADCFTTVSEITNNECRQLLDKPADIVTPNGFEGEFVPKTASTFNRKRNEARCLLRKVAEQVLGYSLAEDTRFVCTSGRYEWRNKGIDAYLHALKQLSQYNDLQSDIVAFVCVPAWQQGVHAQLGMTDHFTTHQLYNPQGDPVMHTLRYLDIQNRREDAIKVIFVPSYLNGNDGIFNTSYYDLLIGMDATVFPSYYEPWGYTPLESVAFRVPTITTSLAGFGQWAQAYSNGIETGVEVIERTDANWHELIGKIAGALHHLFLLSPAAQEQARQAAANIAKRASWENFYPYYEKAYAIALQKAEDRLNKA